LPDPPGAACGLARKTVRDSRSPIGLIATAGLGSR